MQQSVADNQILKSIKSILQPLSLNDVKLSRSYRIPNTAFTVEAVIQLPKGAGVKKLVIEYKKSGEPRLIRNAVLQVKKYLEYIDSSYGVVVAPYISPQAAKICADDGVGYLDLSGNCFFRFGNVFIEKTGSPNKFIIRKEQRSLFSNKATRILRVLLMSPKRSWGVRELAKVTGVSPGYVSRVRQNLMDREWMARTKVEMCLNNPKEVLDEWAKASRFRKSESYFYFTLKNPTDIEAEIANYCDQKKINYALSGFSAAIRYAPMVPAKTVMAYISGDIPKIAHDLGLKSVDSGANVTLSIPYDDGVFYGGEIIDEVKIASPIQVYLDLINVKGRGEEAAQAVFDKKVSPQW